MRKPHPTYAGYDIDDSGRVFRVWKNKELKRYPPNAGSPALCVTINGKNCNVANLVYETFVGPIPGHARVVYRNGDRSDPSLTNIDLVFSGVHNDVSPRVELEEWTAIPGHAGFEASSEGRVRDAHGAILPTSVAGARRQYRQVRLVGNHKILVHRLVAAAFYGERQGMEIDHVDGNASNNRASNLEWVTHAENVRRAYARGTKIVGRSTALPRGLVLDILQRSRIGQSAYSIAKELGMSVSTIFNVVNLKTKLSKDVHAKMAGEKNAV